MEKEKEKIKWKRGFLFTTEWECIICY